MNFKKKLAKSLQIQRKCVILQPQSNKNRENETDEHYIRLVVALETGLVARHWAVCIYQRDKRRLVATAASLFCK